MASTSETGHVKNLAFFEDLIAYCQAYGTDYNPSNDHLKITQLQATYLTAQTSIQTCKIKKTSFDTATNERRTAFETIKQLSTRIINALVASGAPKLTIDDAKGINKKMQGATSKKNTTDITGTENPSAPRTISTSQQSYDRLRDHLANLVQILEQTPAYQPNESDLQLAQLQNRLTELETAKTSWVTAHTQYSNALMARNHALYDPEVGLVKLAQMTKIYVKSIFGSQSHQYKQVSGLNFRTLRS